MKLGQDCHPVVDFLGCVIVLVAFFVLDAVFFEERPARELPQPFTWEVQEP